MKSSRALAALLLLALTTMAGTVWAVGELDGAYALTVTQTEFDSFPLVLVVIQNSPEVVFIVLDQVGLWYYGFGALDAQQVTGTIFASDGFEVGPFSLQFGPGSVTGTLTTFDFDSPSAVSGNQIF